MFFQPEKGRNSGRYLFCLTLLTAALLASASTAFAEPGTTEVATKYKAQHVDQLDLAAYEDELLDCSALAGIHTWIGDNLGDNEGAEVRKVLAEDYWIELSKGYMVLAEQASGDDSISEELGVRMKELAAEFRDLTDSQAPTSSWSDWYDLIDRCDSWRPAKPTHAFYNHGRGGVEQPAEDAATSTS